MFTNPLVYLIKLYVWFVWITGRKYITFAPESLQILRQNKKAIIALWHSRLLPFPRLLRGYSRLWAIVSGHKDGKYLSQYISTYKHRTIEGSTNKGAFAAMRQALELLKLENRVVITPDGPRGPKHQINSNILKLAQKTKTPIICCSYSCTKAKVFNSWDRFILPKPFGKIFIEVGAPIDPGSLHDKEELRSIMMLQARELDQKAEIEIN